MIKYFYVVSLVFALSSCGFAPDHEICFDLEKQLLHSCSRRPLRNISIENEAVTVKGFPLEGGVLLTWEDDQEPAPLTISLQSIPDGYSFSRGGLSANIKYFRLRPNCSYLIEQWGGGRPAFAIKVRTDASGKIYKTTHESCGLNPSAGNGETPAP